MLPMLLANLSILLELTYVQGGVHLELTGNLKNVEARNR